MVSIRLYPCIQFYCFCSGQLILHQLNNNHFLHSLIFTLSQKSDDKTRFNGITLTRPIWNIVSIWLQSCINFYYSCLGQLILHQINNNHFLHSLRPLSLYCLVDEVLLCLTRKKTRHFVFILFFPPTWPKSQRNFCKNCTNPYRIC